MEIGAFLDGLRESALGWLVTWTRPWQLYQIAIAVVLFVVATVAARFVEAHLRERVRGWEGATKRRIRIALVFLNRTRLILYAVLLWGSVIVLQAVTWPSRSYYLALLASLVTTFVVVAILSRLIRNRVLRLIARWGIWIAVALWLLGILPQTVALLDGAAITLGSQRISALLVLKAILLLSLLVGLAGAASEEVRLRVGASETISPSMKVLADKAAWLLFYGLAVIVGLQTVGFDLTTLTVLSGAIGLGLGFGLQKVVSNLVSGIILLLDKSIKPGDVISLGETFGWISTLGARYVSVVTRDGREYLIPNEDLITGQVVNWTHSSELVRLDIYFGVSYASDPHQVRKIASEAAAAVPRVVAPPAPVCHIVGFGDSSIDFILRFWIVDPTQGLTNVRGAVFLALWDALKAADIEIPFPRRDVTIYDHDNPKD